ncbi:MAG: M23 family metallopeptidase [Spirochaetota bacterium]
MKRNVLLISFLIIQIQLISRICLAYEWPVEKIMLTATFGESRKDHFHSGIDIGGGEQEVHPIAEGEIVFFHEEGEDFSGIPTGLGSFIVVEHEGGIKSLYGHLKQQTIPVSMTQVGIKDVIGVIGDTGGSYGPHLHLEIIDKEFGQDVNPLLLLPPIQDKNKPVVRTLSFEKDGSIIPVTSPVVINPGTAELKASIFDLSADVPFYCPMAPFSISVFINGETTFNVVFEALRALDGNIILIQSNNLTFSDFYESDWDVKLGKIDLHPGESRLEIAVKDYAGNTTNRQFLIKVTE